MPHNAVMGAELILPDQCNWNTYDAFLNKKTQLNGMDGFSPVSMPDFLFDFQKKLVEWSLLKGRCAIFAEAGLDYDAPRGWRTDNARSGKVWY